jgi:hypothetical protein
MKKEFWVSPCCFQVEGMDALVMFFLGSVILSIFSKWEKAE